MLLIRAASPCPSAPSNATHASDLEPVSGLPIAAISSTTAVSAAAWSVAGTGVRIGVDDAGLAVTAAPDAGVGVTAAWEPGATEVGAMELRPVQPTGRIDDGSRTARANTIVRRRTPPHPPFHGNGNNLAGVAARVAAASRPPLRDASRPAARHGLDRLLTPADELAHEAHPGDRPDDAPAPLSRQEAVGGPALGDRPSPLRRCDRLEGHRPPARHGTAVRWQTARTLMAQGCDMELTGRSSLWRTVDDPAHRGSRTGGTRLRVRASPRACPRPLDLARTLRAIVLCCAVGGSAWESNPPRDAERRATGFEDREAHRDPSAPADATVPSGPTGRQRTARGPGSPGAAYRSGA